MSSFPLLTVITFLPLVGAGVILLFGNERLTRWVALVTTLATLALSALLFWSFKKELSTLQLVDEYAGWIPTWNIAYRMGVTESVSHSFSLPRS